MKINANELGFRALNEAIRAGGKTVQLTGCLGQRFLAAGMSDVTVKIDGVPGNAQDAVGDTMNAGEIVICGNVGDAAGYAMRGGRIYVKGDAGYRAGIHMKAYREKIPVIVIGGCAGSFLGEYQAGGVIVVLGLSGSGRRIVGNFPCTGMHGGKMILRSDCQGIEFPGQVTARKATAEDLLEIKGYVSAYCARFGLETDEVMDATFTVVTPDSSNPYKRLYVAN